MDQVRSQGAAPAFAKEKSTRFKQYVKRTGSNKCWEIEALDPHYLQSQLQEAILSVLDVEQIMAVQDLIRVERQQITELRQQIRPAVMSILNNKGGQADE